MLCVVCSGVWCRDLDIATELAKTTERFEMWIWRRMELVKWTDKNIVVLERVGPRITMLELIKKRKRNWLGPWLRRNSLLKDALEGIVNRKKV